MNKWSSFKINMKYITETKKNKKKKKKKKKKVNFIKKIK